MTNQLLIKNAKRISITGMNVGAVSDGYHTFDELYEHRCLLWILLCKSAIKSWKSKLHSDGTSYDGWFVLGMKTKPGEQMTYHLPMKYWECCGFAETWDKAPHFDGHTPADVLERLKKFL